MKRLLTVLFIVLASFYAAAQTPSTFKFLGIPVDGKKSQFIAQLKEKGFKYNARKDILTGTFNGAKSNIIVSENARGKVDQIIIFDAEQCDEKKIIDRYNELLQQFKDSEKYLELEENEPILKNENVSYEMSAHDKSYDAEFYFDPTYDWTDDDKSKMVRECQDELDALIASGKYKEPTEEQTEHIVKLFLKKRIIKMINGAVFLVITEQYGKYYMTISYVNLANSKKSNRRSSSESEI